MMKLLVWPDFFSNLSFEYTWGLFKRVFWRFKIKVTSVLFPLFPSLLINLSKNQGTDAQYNSGTNYSKAVTNYCKRAVLGYKVTTFGFDYFILTEEFCFVVVLSCFFFLSLFRHFVAYLSSYGSKIRRSMHLKKFWVSSFFGFGMIMLLIMSNYNVDNLRLLQLQWPIILFSSVSTFSTSTISWIYKICS